MATRYGRSSGGARDDSSQRRWGQYTSIKFTETVVLEGLVASIGTIRDACDNVPAETVMGLYWYEAVAKNLSFSSGPLKTLADVEELTFDWLDWYNNRRLHSSLGTFRRRNERPTITVQLPAW